jgi:plasmid stabilization system protein ParE
MTWPVIVNQEAEADLAEAKAYYDCRRAGLGEEFLTCVEDVLGRLGQTPAMHAKVFQDLRRALVHRFPYAVFYRLDDDQVTVVAVYHTHRDPRGWQGRA